jgi:capsular polysaccharide biosynthesis protein
VGVTTSAVDTVRERPETAPARLPDLALFLRRLWWGGVGLVLGLALGLMAGLSRAPVYDSTGYVTVSAAPGATADATAVARAAQGLARLAAAPSVVADPLRAAGYPEAAARPQLYVSVSAAPDAPLISVTGTADNPVDAQRIALTVSNALAELRPFSSFSASIAAAPLMPSSPTTPTWTVPAAGMFLGLALGVVLAATVPRRR